MVLTYFLASNSFSSQARAPGAVQDTKKSNKFINDRLISDPFSFSMMLTGLDEINQSMYAIMVWDTKIISLLRCICMSTFYRSVNRCFSFWFLWLMHCHRNIVCILVSPLTKSIYFNGFLLVISFLANSMVIFLKTKILHNRIERKVTNNM